MSFTSTGSPTRRRVVLIDDNKLTLDGYAATLTSHDDIELVAAISHDQALRELSSWSDVDVAVLDAADETLRGDQFPGVRVVRHIRACQGDRRTVIVVVTGHFFDDGLRHRMADADADFFFLRAEIRSAAKLTDIVLNPQHYRRGVPVVTDPEQSKTLGVTHHSKLEDLISYVEANGLQATLDPDAARPSTARRSLIRHRHQMGEAGQIAPVNVTTGTQPAQSQHDPSIRQLRRLWVWAARVKYPPHDSPTGTQE